MKLPCTLCDKFYRTKESLSNHIKCMHSEVQCPECGETFSNSGKLKRHQRGKHQNLKFRCVVPNCFKEYMNKQKISEHFAQRHIDIDHFEREHYLQMIKKLQPS